MIKDIVLVGIGSGIGGICRYLISLCMSHSQGGFPTFSTFSKEGLTLLQSNHYTLFALYTLGSMALGIMAVALGYLATK